MSDDKFNRLELGQSQFELIEFSLTRHLNDGTIVKGRYGVNVAKVREVVRMPKINKLSSRIKGVAGVFELRGIPIPAINLAKVLGDDEAPIHSEQQIIVTEFSKKRAGFIVSSTERIRRLAWDKVLPPTADAGTCINGMAFVEDNEFLFILDLEKIIIEIEAKSSPSPIGGGVDLCLGMSMPAVNVPVVGSSAAFREGNALQAQTLDEGHTPLSSQGQHQGLTEESAPYRGKLLLVDDSNLILTACQRALDSLGFTVLIATDGLMAKEFLVEAAENSPGSFPVDAIVTDVEMPRMDGLTLTKWIREESLFKEIPVLLHTSLSGQSNQAAGIAMGANGYVVKNDIKTLVELLSEVIGSHEKVS